MGRKPIDIQKVKAAALEVFMEKGYDGASMRDIAQRAGCSVGLAYNYYATKDEMFTGALDLFFDYHRKNLEVLKTEAVRSPFRALTDLFTYVERQSLEFRRRSVKVHWTVRYAIREHSLTLVEPYVGQTLAALVDWGADFPLPLDFTAHLLTHGVCGMLLRADIEDVHKRRGDVIKSTKIFTGVDIGNADIVVPDFAVAEDMKDCCGLYLAGREHYPRFDICDFAARAERGEIVLIKDGNAGGKAAGMIAFSAQDLTIDAFMVDKDYYGKGVGIRLLVTALAQMPVGATVNLSIALKELSQSESLGFLFSVGFNQAGYEDGVLRLTRKVPERATELLPKSPSDIIG